MASRTRDIVRILGKTEAANASNNALLNTASDVGGIATVATINDLPATHSVGDQIFVTGVSRLYFSNGTGWYSQNIINANPRWADSVGSGVGEPNGTLTITDSATPLIVKAVGVDSDALPLTNSIVLSDSAQYVFSVTQDSSVFTFTPKTKAQATASSQSNLIDSNSADINVTFKVTDGIAILQKPAIITYEWNVTSLYDFTSFVFKPGTSTFNPGQHSSDANLGSGATAMGAAGHTLAEYLANTTDYNQSTHTWLSNTNYFNLYNSTRGFLEWTVPATATYTIKAMGGAGGGTSAISNGSLGGKGSFAQGNMNLTSGGKILLVIGHRGRDSTSAGTSGSGAGGSFVFYREAGGTFTTSDIIMAGGGGGGAALYWTSGNEATSRSAGGDGSTTTAGGNARWDERSGGTNGTGGGYNGNSGGNWSGGDGAGLLSSGQTESRANANPHSNGQGLAKGHHFAATYPFYGGWHNQSSAPSYYMTGGFGGGASGSYGPGGGGGYSGGAGDHNMGSGVGNPHDGVQMANGAGGGGIFFHASATSTSVGVNTNIEAGSITITKN